ncbi:MAG: SPFH domain-containing protein, partial [Acidobacteriota bacterium]
MWMIIQASLAGVCLLGAVIVLLLSVHKIGPSEVGLVTKRFSSRKLDDDNLIAFQGEAGYQSELLMPGLRFRWWPLYGVEKFPWVQIPAGQIGVVLAQVGQPLPVGAKSAVYRPAFGQFADLELFIREGGQKGVQRPVLPPGTTLPIHPVAFLVVTRDQTFGLPANPELSAAGGPITPASFGMNPCDFEVVQIRRGNDARDIVGIVNTLEGSPLPSGDISSRLNGFADVVEMEQAGSGDQDIIEVLLGAKNDLHNNYQDFQAFLDHGGRIGLQHDPLLYGAYTLNPFLVRVELVPMLVIEQGQVAVIKSYVGLPPRDTSGAEFKFGTLVRPGHRGIWQEPLRTGKYPINPYCYKAEIVPTAILTLNWAERVSAAHHLDAKLETITAKSAEGFVFRIDLQVQIHVPDTRAPRVISTVGTINNLVDEVLQAAVGNHFRDTLQSMPAISFIEKRRDVQRQAFERIAELLSIYFVETKGVYIQDVLLPQDLVKVLTEREIAKQEIATFEQQKQAQEGRIRMEQARGTADMQAELAKS